MYGYKEYVPLTPEEILRRVSQEDIFKIIIQQDIILDKGALYRAPYRDDSNADCYFEEYNNILYFADFADTEGKYKKDCFNLIQRTKSLNYWEALNFVNDYLDLGLGDSTKEVKKAVLEAPIQESFIRDLNIVKTITFNPRSFIYKDKEFWSKYGITMQNLLDDKVIPISIYRGLNKRGIPFTVKPFDVMYAYTDFPEGKVKIYRPEAPSKDSKWFTNCNQDDIGSIDHLPLNGNQLIISKSYKDCRVLRNQGLDCIWLQNEGMIPSPSIIRMLGRRFDKMIVWFDNDQTGLARGKAIKDYINTIYPDKATTVFLPPRLLLENIKDPSDLIASKGKDQLTEFLRNKQLL